MDTLRQPCDIFISHSAIDGRLAVALKEELETRLSDNGQEQGSIRCFCSSDPTDLPPGTEWPKEVQEALRSTKVFLLIVSSASLARPWVWFEVGTCWFREAVRIVPVCFGGQKPGGLPPPLNVKQAVRGEEFGVLLRSIAKTLNRRADEGTVQRVSERLAAIDAELSADRKEALVVLPLLQSNEWVLVAPDRPLNAQEGGFTVTEVHSDSVKLRKASSAQLVSIPRSGIERVERSGGGTPARLVLKGRLQWLTLSKEWACFPEPPSDDYGLPRSFHSGIGRNPDIEQLVHQAKCYGVEVCWANLDRVHTQRGKHGEIVYFNDGRYARSEQRQLLVRG